MKNYIPVNPKLYYIPDGPASQGAPPPKLSNIGTDGKPMQLSPGENQQIAFIKPVGRVDTFGRNSIITNTDLVAHFDSVSSGIFFEPGYKAHVLHSQTDSQGNSTFTQSEDPDFKNNQEFGHQIANQSARISRQVSGVLLNNRFAPRGMGGISIAESGRNSGFAPLEEDSARK